MIEEMEECLNHLLIIKAGIPRRKEAQEVLKALSSICEDVRREKESLVKYFEVFCECVRCYEESEKIVQEKTDWHSILDIGGMIPGIGGVFDAANTVWYMAEGNIKDAVLSGAMFLPGVGEILGIGKNGKKIGKVITEYSDEVADAVKRTDKVKDAGKYVDDVVEGGLDALSTPSSKVLRQNLIDAGVEVPDYPNAAHHIVAGSSTKAAEARAILQKYGVDINDAANGTFLPTVKDVAEGAYHPSLHTNAYYDKVNKLLSEATCKEDVLDILEFIGDELSSGTFMQ